MVKRLLLAGLLALMLSATQAEAQTTVAVDINKAKLVWTWTPGPGSGTPTEFLMKCGTASKTYTKITSVAFPTTELAIRNAITGSGSWFCAVSASNQFGESGLSNEVPFSAGAAPSGSISASIVAQ